MLWDLDGLENAVQFHRQVCEMLVLPCCCFLTVGMLLDHVVCLFYFIFSVTAGLLIIFFYCFVLGSDFCSEDFYFVHAAKL